MLAVHTIQSPMSSMLMVGSEETMKRKCPYEEKGINQFSYDNFVKRNRQDEDTKVINYVCSSIITQ